MDSTPRHPRPRWILGLLLFLLVLPVVGWWGLAPRRSYPVDVLMPTRLSAALRLSHAAAAWQRHWLRAGVSSVANASRPRPEEAVRRILEALDEWDREVRKYGETQARLRLTLYQQALFQALGDEAWLVFGEWGSDPAGENSAAGRVGMVALLRATGSIKSRVGPLADLLLEEYNIERTTYKGVALYEYKAKRLGRSLTFCQVGGWICTSLRQRGPGPLFALIDQVRAAEQRNLAGTPRQDFWPRQAGDPADPAISFIGYPGDFLAQLRQFTSQRERSFSKKSRKSLAHWEQALQGTDRVALTQAGDSLLDLRLELHGERAASLSKSLASEAQPPAPAGTPGDASGAGEAELAQLDFDLAFAKIMAPLAGFSWGELLKDLKNVDLLLPGLRERLRAALDTGQVAPAGRIGLAAWPSHQTLLPGLLFWLDQSPERPIRTAPAGVWRADLEQHRPLEAGDDCLWVSPFTPLAANAANNQTASPLSGAPEGWFRFENALLAQPATRPLGFVTLNFPALSAELRSLPMALLSKKVRKQAKHWQATSDALALAFGGVALRLDATDDRWILTTHTP